MARFFFWAGLLVAALFGATLIDGWRREKAVAAATERQIAQESALNAARDILAKRHNAFVVSDEGLEQFNYTIQFQRALVSTNGQPILFTARLADIFESEGRQFVRFTKDSFSGLNVMFDLECAASEIELPKVKHHWESPKYDVVAEVRFVRRPTLQAAAQSDYENYPVLSVETSDFVVATGRCLEVRRIPH